MALAFLRAARSQSVAAPFARLLRPTRTTYGHLIQAPLQIKLLEQSRMSFSVRASALRLVSNGWDHVPRKSKTPRKAPPAGKEKQEQEEEEEEQDQSERSSSGNKGDKQPKVDPLHAGFFVLATGAAFLFLARAFAPDNHISWNEFVNSWLVPGKVGRLVVVDGRLVSIFGPGDVATKASFVIGSVESFERKLEEAQQLLNREPSDYVSVVYKNPALAAGHAASIINGIAFSAFTAYFVYSLVKQSKKGTGGLFGMGSKIKKFKRNEKISVSFKDVAGLPEAKGEVMEFVDFLKNPSSYEKLGAKIPKGALLVGPPGTGKTLLAKATAGEASVPFYSCAGSDFVEMFVGVGPGLVRELFAEARKNSPCIIFIDEIDAIGRKRDSGSSVSGNDEAENTLNQLLVEMDGFTTNTGIVVLAGTNRQDVLDPALTRPGRFDRTIAIDSPDVLARKEIFAVHLKPIKVEPGTNIEQLIDRLSRLSPGFSGADIANVCNEAALIAARNEHPAVVWEDFNNAIERVIGGLEKKNRVILPSEKKTVATHEAGHAVLGWFLEHCDPLLKVSIIPRGKSQMGYSQYDTQEHFLYTKEELLDMMCKALAGRAAEEIEMDQISSASEDDLERVTNLAYAQVRIYGMNARVGAVSFQDKGNTFRAKPYSDYTAQMIDEEVRALVRTAYTRAKDLLMEHREALQKVAAELLQKEVLQQEDILALLGPRPFPLRHQRAPPIIFPDTAKLPSDSLIA